MHYTPDRSYGMRAMDKRQEHLIYAALSCLLLGAGVVLFCMGYHAVTCALVMMAGAWNLILSVRKAEKEKGRIMDLTRGEISLEDGRFTCMQAAANGTYENCSILISDITHLVEGQERGVPRFYITLSEDAEYSVITVDGKRTGRKAFEVLGEGYKEEEFKEVYLAILKQLPDTAVLAGVTESQTAWRERTPLEDLIWMLVPWTPAAVAAVIHLAAGLVC